jgi:hypothetical protein
MAFLTPWRFASLPSWYFVSSTFTLASSQSARHFWT